MSIPVPVEGLASVVAGRPFAYLATTDGDRVKVVQVSLRQLGDALEITVGPGSLRNLRARPTVVLVMPPSATDDEAFTLLVDGVVDRIDGSDITIRPTSAVLHRRAPD